MDNMTVAELIGIIKTIIYIVGILIAIYKIPEKLMKSIKETISKEIKPISEKIDENEVCQLRYQILCFASDLRKGQLKTRQEFETIFAFYDKYEAILKELNQHNGYLDTEFAYIRSKYNDLEIKKMEVI